MPVHTMAEPVVDHHRRFQAAVDVIHSLPKTGWYRPSYQVMLKFYSLYKQSVCGPCTVSRPGFWDPVGRVKWDAWSSLGVMSSEQAMVAYVDEIKKVARQVIDTVPMNEKTASIFKHFEPLYLEIQDMPRPPDFLFKESRGSQDLGGLKGLAGSEGTVPTSDSESETFCDSVDCVDQLKGHEPISAHRGRQVGSGHGGERVEDGQGQRHPRRERNPARGADHHDWGERGQENSSKRGSLGVGPAGGGGSEGGPEQHDGHLQQQIVLTLQRLREDMRSVMERLKAVEELASSEDPGWGLCQHCAASEQERWWSLDVSSSTFLFFLLWPFAAQVLLLLLKRVRRSKG